MTHRLVSVVALAFMVGAAAAQESTVLSEIDWNQKQGGSLVAVPENNAPEIGDDPNALLYGTLTAEQEANILEKAFPLMSAKWAQDYATQGIFVCWEAFPDSQAHDRQVVRQAIVDTWEKHSALKFIGWTKCVAGQEGIRIRVEDSNPRVKFLGKYINRIPNGMILNFTYANYSPTCQAPAMKDRCTRMTAVHEFGHAIGFAHEQNRPDTPDECTVAPQGQNGDLLLTPWDKHSVMNYCNPVVMGNGNLSQFDILAVQHIYGKD